MTKPLPVTTVARDPRQARTVPQWLLCALGTAAGCERKDNVWALVAWHSRLSVGGPDQPDPLRRNAKSGQVLGLPGRIWEDGVSGSLRLGVGWQAWALAKEGGIKLGVWEPFQMGLQSFYFLSKLLRARPTPASLVRFVKLQRKS